MRESIDLAGGEPIIVKLPDLLMGEIFSTGEVVPKTRSCHERCR